MLNSFTPLYEWKELELREEKRLSEVTLWRSLEPVFMPRVDCPTQAPDWSRGELWALEPVQCPGLGVVSPRAAVSSWAKGFT